MSTRIAVPSANPGGLDAPLMAHFGHCEVFTIVDVDAGTIQEVSVLPNMPHEHGGCTAPVQFLAEQGVSVLLAGGMGMRPLQAFMQRGIDVRFTGMEKTVGNAVAAFAQDRLPQFGDNGLCKGGCGHH